MAKSKKKKAEEIKRVWESSNSVTRLRWETRSQKGYDFFLDNQLSASEKSALESQGMPTFTINRITPAAEMLSFYATANSPRWQAVGREGSDADIAAMFADMMAYIWDLSGANATYANIINDSIAKGVGYFIVDIDPNSDSGMGDVVLKQAEPYDVYVDPKSRHSLFDDAAFIVVKKNLPRRHLLNLLPKYRKQILKANGVVTEVSYSEKSRSSESNDFQYKDIVETWDIDGEQDELLEYFEVYKKVQVLYQNVFYRVPPTAEEIRAIKEQAQIEIQKIAQEMQVQMLEKQQQIMMAVQAGEMIPERAELEMQKMQEEMQMTLQQKEMELVSQLEEARSVVEQKIVTNEEFKALSTSPEFEKHLEEAIPFYQTRVVKSCAVGDQFLYETRTPSEHYPLIPFMYKWTGTPYPMSAIMPLIGKQQEINKAHQLMIHNASLSSSLRWIYEEGSIDESYWEKHGSAPGALLRRNPGFENPTPVMPLPLSNAFGSLVQMDKEDMEYMSGMWSSMMGDVGTQHDTYRGLLANDEYGTRRVRNWQKNALHPALKRAGEVTRDYSQALYTAHKVFRVVQPNNISQSKEVQINIPIYNDFGEVIGKWNDYASAKMDVQIVSGDSLPVNRWAYLGELKELLQMGVVDDIAVLAETDIKNKERIMQRKSLYSQLQGQIQQMEESLKDKEGTIETLERQLVQSGIKGKVLQAEKEIVAKKEQAKAAISKDQFATEAQQRTLRYDREAQARSEKERKSLATQDFVKSLDFELSKVKEKKKKT